MSIKSLEPSRPFQEMKYQEGMKKEDELDKRLSAC